MSWTLGKASLANVMATHIHLGHDLGHALQKKKIEGTRPWSFDHYGIEHGCLPRYGSKETAEMIYKMQ